MGRVDTLAAHARRSRGLLTAFRRRALVPDGIPRAIALASVLWCSVSAASAEERFAIVVGNDIGQPFRERLWFSRRDAERLSATLREIGAFAPQDVALLEDRSPADVRAAFAAVDARVRNANKRGEKTLLLFYYSGHANDAGLELGSQELAYAELKALLSRSDARVRIALLDACSSGQLTRTRGASPIPTPFQVAPRVESDQEGFAYFASASIGEAAQESNDLQAGFFTSYFDAAMRGAADFDGDGQVTLAEAFRYAALRTTAATELTPAGAQHPRFDVQLVGRGDVVLTSLRSAQGALLLPAAPDARYVLQGPAGFLSEFPGPPNPVVVAVPRGHYVVQRWMESRIEQAEIDADGAEPRPIPAFSTRAPALARMRGGPVPQAVHATVAATSGSSFLGDGIEWQGEIAVNRVFGPVDLRVSVGLSNIVAPQDPGREDLLTVRGDFAVLWPFTLADWLLLELGPQGGLAWTNEVTEGTSTTRTAGQGILGGLVLLNFWAGPVRLGPQVAVEAHLFNIGSAAHLAPVISSGIFLGF